MSEKNINEMIKEKNKNLIINIIIVIIIGILVYAILNLLLFDSLNNNYIRNENLNISYDLNKDLIPDPIQNNIKHELFTEKIRGVDINITKLATYDITGKVEAIEKYSTNRIANILSFKGKNVIDFISPIDLTLSWGEIALRKNSNKIYANQYYMNTERIVWYEWNSELERDYTRDYIRSHISNNHLISLNNGIRRELEKVKIGDVVRICGYLVDVKTSNNIRWGPSSMKRTDGGNHSCEIIYIEDFIIMR